MSMEQHDETAAQEELGQQIDARKLLHPLTLQSHDHTHCGKLIVDCVDPSVLFRWSYYYRRVNDVVANKSCEK
jgi:hypothetical protein